MRPLKKVGLFASTHLLGDALIRLHAAQRLRQTWPDVELVWLSNGRSPMAGRLKQISAPLINRVRDEIDLDARTPLPESFDAILDLELLRDFAMSRRIKERFQPKIFISQARGFALSTRRPPFPRAHLWWLLRPPTFVRRFVYLADLLTGERRSRPLPYLHHNLAPWRDLAARALPAPTRYVGFAPGSGNVRKIWPLERFLEIAQDCQRRGFGLAFFLGPDEHEMRARIADALPQARFPEEDLPAARRPLEGVGFAMACAARLAAALANDSGAGHIFAGAHIPLVLLFRDADTKRFEPHIASLKKLSANHYDRLPYRGKMARIKVSSVRRALDIWLPHRV